MSRKSVKEEKNLYQIARERLGWSREYASEVTGLSTSHLERIESGKIIPKADAVIILARDYVIISVQANVILEKRLYLSSKKGNCLRLF